MLGSSHLTSTSEEQMLTVPGMAFFAGTGPIDKTCNDCKFKGYWRRVVDTSGNFIKSRRVGGCAKFHELTGTHGPAISRYLRSCKYFDAADKSAQG
jgi:hypothetical protein